MPRYVSNDWIHSPPWIARTYIRVFVVPLVLLASLISLVTPAHAIERCGSGKRITCVVDGDTLWLKGEKIRLQGFDTPETSTNLCGGAYERRLGHQATNRLVQLLNSGNVQIQRTGRDRYGRTLANIWVGKEEVGDILISEGLARRWPDGREFWCR